METNNKMREALMEALEHVNNVYDILSKPCVEIEKARQGCREVRGVLIPALAEPATTEKTSVVGDAAKLRDALKEIRARLVYLYGRTDGTFDPPALKEVCEIADEALVKPPRNCDVGTVIDQRKRYAEMCQYHCDRCALQDSWAWKGGCALAWAQMPYNEGGAK